MDARVHDGPGAPIVRLRWMYTDLPFLPVGTQCVINNRNLNEDQSSVLAVGQLPPDTANYKQDARWKLPAGMKPGHICHAEWLATGEPWPNDLPPTVYGPSWIPECCDLFQDSTAGGVQIGGTAGDVFTGTDASIGGWVIGGQAGSRAAGVDPAVGGWVIGQQAADLQLNIDPAAGGVQIGGTCGDVFTYGDGASGGFVIGQFAGDVQGNTDPAAGGVEVGGPAGDVFSIPDPAAGGVQIGSACGDVFSIPDPAAGGVQIGGAAGDVFTPPTPTYGTTTGTGTTVNLPTNTNTVGRLIVMVVTDGYIVPTISGYTQIGTDTEPGTGLTCTAFLRTANGATTATLSNAGAWVAWYDATHTTNDGAAVWSVGGATTSCQAFNTITTTGAADGVFICWGVNAVQTITIPAGLTATANTSTASVTIRGGSKTMTSAGLVGQPVATTTPARQWVGFILTLK